MQTRLKRSRDGKKLPTKRFETMSYAISCQLFSRHFDKQYGSLVLSASAVATDRSRYISRKVTRERSSIDLDTYRSMLKAIFWDQMRLTVKVQFAE
jgi:hypothetical protein